MFTAALFITVKKWNQPKHPSTDEWINKTWYIHVLWAELRLPQNSHVEALTLNVTMFGDRAFKEVIKVK